MDLELILKIFSTIVLSLGLIGNFFGLITLVSKKMLAIGTRSMHRFLFISDSFYLSLIVPLILQEYEIYLTKISDLLCKGFYYFTGAISIVSPMILIYISFDRYLSLKYLNKIDYLRRNSIQLGYILGVILANASYYLILPFSFSIHNMTIDNSNVTICNFNSKYDQIIIMNMDLGFRVMFPFVLMIITSALLINKVVMSGRRVLANNSSNENKRIKRDIKFAISSISLNFVYIILNLPISLALIFVESLQNNLFLFLYYIYFSRSAINFYLLFLTNSLFRTEFKKLIFRKN